MVLAKQNLGDISNTDLQTITENVYFLEDAFGMDFAETFRVINGLMTSMGVDAQTAFNLMVTGAQNGLDSDAYNLDKVNDLVKEMGIFLTDGSVEKNLSSFIFLVWKVNKKHCH